MRILSFDVGIINLAYCVLDKNNEGKVTIIDWNLIDLIKDDRVNLCCHGRDKYGEKCKSNPSQYITLGSKNIGYCKKHLNQRINKYDVNTIKKYFEIVKEDQSCCGQNRKKEQCTKKIKYELDGDYYCQSHQNAYLKKLEPKPIKNVVVKDYPTIKLQSMLIDKMDSLIVHFAKLGIEHVIIENQPVKKNGQMKSIASTLFDYFMIRGMKDHCEGLNLSVVKFSNPINKLKVNQDNTIEVLNRNKNKKYKLTKALSVLYTKQLITDQPHCVYFLSLFTKQDDLCDSYLQGRYYLTTMK